MFDPWDDVRAEADKRLKAMEDANDGPECEELRVVGPDHRNVGGAHDPDCPVNDY